MAELEPPIEVTPPNSPGGVDVLDDDDDDQSDSSTSELSELREKLADEVRLRQYTEQVLDLRQQELEERDAQNQKLANQVLALKRELSETQQQLVSLQNQNKNKSKQLSDAKDQIFRLQPSRNHITEAEAIDAYKRLCGNVHRWVEHRMKPILFEFDQGRIKSRPTPVQANRFVSLLRDAGKRCLRVDQTDEYHVVSIIMHYLWLVFFSKEFYCPLDDYDGDSTLGWINDIEASMMRLPRDVTHCRDWRSETLTACTNLQSFKSRRARYLNLVAEDLASLLSIIVPKASATELQGSLRRVIVDPAADLVHQFHLAPSIFTLKWPARGAWSRLEVYECTNLASGGLTIDLTGTTASSPARRKVSYLFDVAPGLFVERVEGAKKAAPKAICRPNVLVHGGDGEIAQKATLVRWIWDHAAATGFSQEPVSRSQTPARAGGTARR